MPLVKSNVKLQMYREESLNLLGEFKENVFIDNKCIPDLKILLVKEEGPCLIDKIWLKLF